jgi:hypothetical protein
MKFLTHKALIFVCSAMCINCFYVNAAAADTATYVYRGNTFEELDGEPGVFSTKDRVTGHFTVDCSIAHPEGTCANLPYDNYFWTGAVALESVELSAGPASLPTVDGHADVGAFWFSTDENGQIVNWDIDLSLWDPSGIINVDTDKKPWGSAIDSAAVSGGFANVSDNPGKWKKVGSPGKFSKPFSSDNSRRYGNEVSAGLCVTFASGERCSNVHAWEDYDVKGTYQFTGINLDYWFIRFFPEGGWRTGSRWMYCAAGLESFKARPNHVSLDAALHPGSPECDSSGFIEECDASWNCEWTPWGFPEPTVVTGEWIDPMNSSKAVVNRTDNFFDPWSETSSKIVNHCNEQWGELMAQGGFSIDLGTRVRHFPFEGFDTQGWSHFWLRSCNENFKAK